MSKLEWKWYKPCITIIGGIFGSLERFSYELYDICNGSIGGSIGASLFEQCLTCCANIPPNCIRGTNFDTFNIFCCVLICTVKIDKKNYYIKSLCVTQTHCINLRTRVEFFFVSKFMHTASHSIIIKLKLCKSDENMCSNVLIIVPDNPNLLPSLSLDSDITNDNCRLLSFQCG